MRTLKQYIDWMKLCQRKDPDCTNFLYHLYREKKFFKGDLEMRGTFPRRYSPIERIYRQGPQGMLDLDNCFLYLGGTKAGIEDLLTKTGFVFDEETPRRNVRGVFDDIPVDITNYSHSKGATVIRFVYRVSEPLLCMDVIETDGDEPLSWYEVVRQVGPDDAEMIFDACIVLNHYGQIPHRETLHECDILTEKLMRDNSLPLLEGIVERGLPALLRSKATRPMLLNRP